jgi:alanyl-tRNA synthetase
VTDFLVPGTHGMVVSGAWIFREHDTHGQPIEVTLELLRRERLYPDCRGLLKEMVAHGWHEERARERIRCAYMDAYPTGCKKWVRWWEA